MSGRAGVLWQYLIPQRLVASVVYRAARSRRRWLARRLIHWFAATYQLDLGEAERSSLDDYESLNDLFTRALAPGTRPIATDAGAFVAPADGTLTQAGTIERGMLLQAKGIHYGLAELLGDSDVADFDGGTCATIYLAPHNYHRVHVPFAGALTQTRYITGDRFSVNTQTAAAVPRLFARNERAVFRFETESFTYYLVMVGALNVSSISTATRGELPSGKSMCWPEADRAIFATGAEIGRFNLGSTVIVVLPPGTLEWRGGTLTNTAVRLGECLGRIVARGGN